jgi:hypothetical protein
MPIIKKFSKTFEKRYLAIFLLFVLSHQITKCDEMAFDDMVNS